MATRRSLEIQAEELNRKQRNLRKYLFYSAKDFWSKTSLNRDGGQPEGCTVISGGSVTKRESVLLSMLDQVAERRIPTVMIVNGSVMPDIDDRMIELVSYNPGAQLIITSAENSNYDFFSGWTVSQIVDFFVTCVTCTGGNLANMPNYLHQYFNLVEKVYGEVTLRTLMDAAETADWGQEVIEGLEQRLGDEIDTKTRITLDYLHKTTDQRQHCEAMVRSVLDGLGALQTENVGYSLKKCLPGSGEIILIHTEDVSDPELLAIYFEKEMSSRKRLPFQLIVCECADEKMTSWAKTLINTGSAVTFCTQSIYAALGEDATRSPFQNIVFLFNNGSVPLNAERELAMLGSIDYWQVTEGGSSPPMAFSFWTGTHAGIVNTNRNKVMPQDVEGCEAVLYGHSKFLSINEIALVRKLCD